MKVTIRNTNNGQTTSCTNMAHAKRILKTAVKRFGKEALKGIYVDMTGERDPYYAQDLI